MSRYSDRTAWTPTRQAGLSLVELMISMSLGLLILAALGYIYSGSRQSYAQQETLAAVQQNGRYALDTLAQDLRMAGNIGCARLGDTIPPAVPPAGMVVPIMRAAHDSRIGFDLSADPSRTLSYGAGQVTPLSGGLAAAGLNASGLRNTLGISNNVQAGTDLLVIHRGASQAYPVTAMAAKAGPITIAGSPGGLRSDQQDILLISDCRQADIFHVTNTVPASPDADDAPDITPNAALTVAYGPNAMVMGLESSVYFIRRVDLDKAVGPGNPLALYRARWGVDTSQADGSPDINLIAEHVQDMSVLFGLDDGANGGTADDGAADRYVTGATVGADWVRVVGARISLLLRSPENGMVPQAQTYRFDTDKDGDLETVNAPDRHLYQVYTTTIALRARRS